LIYFAVPDAARQAALEARGATLVHMPGAGGKVDLAAMLLDLGRREVNELHVEAGHKLNGSLVREGLADEFLVYLAPKLIGQGRGMAGFGPIGDLSQAVALQFLGTEMVGDDLRIVARARGRDAF
jgi:diaminohydroxyphosphoribosylaminopyrimidine deaminase/5-amino-6-(5-phosphoribosylamino)uracil reductase